MKKQITKGLFLAATLVAVMSMPANAANPENQTFSATLGNTISFTSGGSINASITPLTGVLDSAKNSTFTIDANYSPTIYVYATAVGSDATADAFFQNTGQTDTAANIALANITSPPTAAQIRACQNSAGVSTNPNAIAYPITSLAFSSGGTGATIAYGTDSKDQYDITSIPTGQSATTMPITATPTTATYSNTNDEAGTYSAVITMTTTSL